MRILAIETSCDETAIAILEINGRKSNPRFRVLANMISSQVKLHAKFGGVVPNLARREHEKNLVPLLVQGLQESNLYRVSFPRKRESRNRKIWIPDQVGNDKNTKQKLQKLESLLNREQGLLKRFKKSIMPLAVPRIDAIAVTYGPGLAPALWVGINFARALSFLWNKPLIPVNHMAGHFYSALLEYNPAQPKSARFKKIKFPALALLVSGGHTELVLVSGHGMYHILGATLDDAAGEAFDKVARILGLKYPGGPEIARIAESKIMNHRAVGANIKLPRPMMGTKNYDFSFSGLKTAVLYLVRDLTKKYPLVNIRPAIAREFQQAVIDVLVAKTLRAAKEFRIKTVTLGGGVAANTALRERLRSELAKRLPGVSLIIPELSLAGDNALMIALAAYFSGQEKAWTDVQADANIAL